MSSMCEIRMVQRVQTCIEVVNRETGENQYIEAGKSQYEPLTEWKEATIIEETLYKWDGEEIQR